MLGLTRRYSLATCLATCLATALGCDAEPGAKPEASAGQAAGDFAADAASVPGTDAAALPVAQGDSAAPFTVEVPPPPKQAPPYVVRKGEFEIPLHPIDDPSGRALDPLFAALRGIDEYNAGHVEGAPLPELVRVLHLGDSSIGRDGFPDEIRSRLWLRFGDGGPGFLMPDEFTGFYKPKSAQLKGNGKWKYCYIAYGCRPDGHYGLGGVVFSSTGRAVTEFRTTHERSPRPWGRSWAHAELWYAAVPGGGQLSVTVDGGEPQRFDARNETWEDRWWSTELDAGPHTLSLRTRGFGRSRLYGVVLESAGPGVVWDAIPMSGAFTKRLLFWDEDHLREQVAHRRPDLIVFQFGGNDLKRIVTGTKPDTFRDELNSVLPRLRAGAPDTACLVVGIGAHGRSGHFDVAHKHVQTIVDVQREAAFANGCAFFDSYGAMGGKGSLRAWRKRGLIWGDLAHLTPRGHGEMAEILWSAMSSGYVAYRRRGQRDASAGAPPVERPGPPEL